MSSSGKKINPNRVSNKKLDEVLSEFRTATTTATVEKAEPGHAGLTTATAFVTAALPTYLFTTAMFEMGFFSNIIIYAIVMIAAGAALAYAYHHTNRREFARLAQNPKRTGDIVTQAAAWSVFINNAFFTTIFLFLAFYVFARFGMPAPVVYVLSVGTPAALVATNAHLNSKKK